MGDAALAKAKGEWPSDAGPFPVRGDQGRGDGLPQGNVGPGVQPGRRAAHQLGGRDALLIHMYERIRGTIGRRYQQAITKFAAWQGNPTGLARELVTIGDHLGFDRTWLELRHLFGFDGTVTQNSALPALNVVMRAANALAPWTERNSSKRCRPSRHSKTCSRGSRASQCPARRQAGRRVPQDGPRGYDDYEREIAPAYQDPTQLFGIVDSMPALREELYRLIGLGFDPTKEIHRRHPLP